MSACSLFEERMAQAVAARTAELRKTQRGTASFPEQRKEAAGIWFTKQSLKRQPRNQMPPVFFQAQTPQQESLFSQQSRLSCRAWDLFVFHIFSLHGWAQPSGTPPWDSGMTAWHSATWHVVMSSPRAYGALCSAAHTSGWVKLTALTHHKVGITFFRWHHFQGLWNLQRLLLLKAIT